MDANSLQLKLQQAVDKMISDIDMNRLRGIQKKSYLDMAKCFDDKYASQQQVQQCLATKSAAVQSAQSLLQNEMNQFQNRLQRATMACQDEVHDKFPNAGEDSAQMNRAEQHMLKCSNGKYSTPLSFYICLIFVLTLCPHSMYR